MTQDTADNDRIALKELPDAWRGKAEAHETQKGIIDLSYAHALRDCAEDLEQSIGNRGDEE